VEIIERLWGAFRHLTPTLAAAVGVALGLFIVRVLLEKRYSARSESQFRGQLIMLGLSLVGLLAILMVLPITEASRGQILGFLGILLSAAVALSSTTLLGNIMAGVMLRSLRGFRAGDFIQVGEHFGRVSERGLFHVEIQTETRDLTTLPNLYLVTQPVNVVNAAGTIVAATCRWATTFLGPRSRSFCCKRRATPVSSSPSFGSSSSETSR
jgi:small conductance mechanosensitive channel